MTYTTRCNAAERAAFKRWTGNEPALGTLEERLSIALARLGQPQRIVLTREERELREMCQGDGTWTQDDLPWGRAS